MTLTQLKRMLKSHIMNSSYVTKKREAYKKRIRAFYDYNRPTPTIICCSCIAGMIYNNLGLKFMSPTINLWMDSEELSKFAENPRFYLEQDIEFIHDDPEYDYDYPVGKIADVYLYFTHYMSDEEAATKWYERRKRFDEDNLYIIADDKGLSEKGRQRFINSKHKRLLIITNGTPRDEYDLHLDYSPTSSYAVRNVLGIAPFEKSFNYAAWLSDKDDIRFEG